MALKPWRDVPEDGAERDRIVALFPSVWHLETLLDASEAVAEFYVREAQDARQCPVKAIRHDGTGSLDRLLRALGDARAAYELISPATAARLDLLGMTLDRAGYPVLPWAREVPMRDLRDPDDRAQPLPVVPIKPALATSRLGTMLTDQHNFVSAVRTPDEPPVAADYRACLPLAGVWRDQTGQEPEERNEPFLQFCQAVLWPVQDMLSSARSSVADLIGAADRTLEVDDDPWSDSFKTLPVPFDDPTVGYLHRSAPNDEGAWSTLRIVELHDVPFWTAFTKDDGCSVYPTHTALCEEGEGTRTAHCGPFRPTIVINSGNGIQGLWGVSGPQHKSRSKRSTAGSLTSWAGTTAGTSTGSCVCAVRSTTPTPRSVRAAASRRSPRWRTPRV